MHVNVTAIELIRHIALLSTIEASTAILTLLAAADAERAGLELPGTGRWRGSFRIFAIRVLLLLID